MLHQRGYFVSTYFPIVLLISFAPVYVALIIVARDRLHVAVTIGLMTIFWTIITFNQVMATSEHFSVLVWALMMLFYFPMSLLTVAPAKAISRRLIFLALGLLLLIALNELSKLGLDVTAPKLQG